MILTDMILGDKVLIEVAEKLEALVLENGIVVRLGGDEFVVVQLSGNDDLSADIINTIEKPLNIEKIKIEISTSIGIVKSLGFSELDAMLVKADENMYKNKEER